jgi:hypothetical protein
MRCGCPLYFQVVLRSYKFNQNRMPDPPATDVPQGVLPRLISTLVQRRRQVKTLMKDRSNSQAKLAQVSSASIVQSALVISCTVRGKATSAEIDGEFDVRLLGLSQLPILCEAPCSPHHFERPRDIVPDQRSGGEPVA